MIDTCDFPGCTNEATGYLPEERPRGVHPRACRTHADARIVFQRSYGYVDRDEAETHVREVIAEAMDALNELAEFDGFRGAEYGAVSAMLVAAVDEMLRLEAQS